MGPAFRLVALDLDGTLLDSRARLSARNQRAVAACLEAGVHATLATGKLLVSSLRVCEALGLTDPQITANGAALMDPVTGAALHVTPLPLSGYREAMRALLVAGLPAAAYTPFAIYSPRADSRLDAIVAIHEPEPAIVSDLAARETMGGAPFVKILTVLPEDGPDRMLEGVLRAELEGALTVVRTSAVFLEFLGPGVDKGTALARVAHTLAIPLSCVLAIGDSYNDLPMLRRAGYGIAMGNAPAAVRAAAAYLTLDNDHDGVAEALYRHVLSGLDGRSPSGTEQED